MATPLEEQHSEFFTEQDAVSKDYANELKLNRFEQRVENLLGRKMNCAELAEVWDAFYAGKTSEQAAKLVGELK